MIDIYRITEKETGMMYIGRTTRPIHHRIAEHKSKKSLIGKAIVEKGLDAFTVEIVDGATSYEEGRRLEKEWMRKCDCFHPKGFNLADGDSRHGLTNGFYRKRHRKSTINGNIESQKTRRPVKNLLNGEVFKSVRECARSLGISKVHVSRICKGRVKATPYKLCFI